MTGRLHHGCRRSGAAVLSGCSAASQAGFQPEVKPGCCESLLRAPSPLPSSAHCRQQSSSGLQRGGEKGGREEERGREGGNE